MRKEIRILILRASIGVLIVLPICSVFAQVVGEVVTVSVPSTVVYRAASENGKTSSVLKQGRKIQVVGPIVNGFVPTKTKTGTTVWLHASDLNSQTQSPSTSGSEKDGQPQSVLGLERMSFDVGVGNGSHGGAAYTEFELGINSYFKSWLAWRNGVFARFPRGFANVYGIDTSLRGIMASESAGVFVGPGYRIASQSNSAPFVEAGMVVKLVGISIGGGAKYIFDSFIYSGQANDQEIFFFLASGGAI